MITPNGINIEITDDFLIIDDIRIPLLRESDLILPQYKRDNRREELLLTIAEICAERYGLVLSYKEGDSLE